MAPPAAQAPELAPDAAPVLAAARLGQRGEGHQGLDIEVALRSAAGWTRADPSAALARASAASAGAVKPACALSSASRAVSARDWASFCAVRQLALAGAQAHVAVGRLRGDRHPGLVPTCLRAFQARLRGGCGAAVGRRTGRFPRPSASPPAPWWPAAPAAGCCHGPPQPTRPAWAAAPRPRRHGRCGPAGCASAPLPPSGWRFAQRRSDRSASGSLNWRHQDESSARVPLCGSGAYHCGGAPARGGGRVPGWHSRPAQPSRSSRR